MSETLRKRPSSDGATVRVNKIIVIVDDFVDLLDVTAMLLESEGYLVLCAEDAETGVRLAKETRADLVLLDYAMPHMSGAAAARALREFDGSGRLKIIMTSATPESQVRSDFDDYDEFVKKPMPPGDLVQLVATLLDS